jgi:prepilin signal peptidase PulO-like enzyme (type II secretory pathway)
LDFAQYWIVLVGLLGAVVGSFLNVVIYRLPRGLSVTNPRWSFCPHCRNPIRAYHNVPILSWLFLRGRCRYCGATIPAIYPLIECITLLLFITVWDALFTAQMVPGVKSPAADWPVAIAYLFLFGGLLAGAAMDIESYIIDIRICILVVAAGVVGQALRWGLPAQAGASGMFALPTTLPPALCLVGVAAGAAWLATSLGVGLLRRGAGRHGPDDDGGGTGDRAGEDLPEPTTADEVEAKSAQRFRPLAIIMLCGLTLALFVWQLAAHDYSVFGRIPPGGQRGFVACFIFMVVLVLASMVSRESDTQIVEEIEAERPGARRVAIHELAWFIPSIVAGIAVFLLLRRSGHLGDDWSEASRALVSDHRWAWFIAGGAHALAAGLLAAGIGWAVRILGTLAFGKEAFGTGDIYIMAAIGAVGGLPLLIFAFFLGAILALVGVLATFFHKSSRAIPFGPWLTIGTLVALWLQPILLEFFKPAATMLWSLLCGRSEAWSFGG